MKCFHIVYVLMREMNQDQKKKQAGNYRLWCYLKFILNIYSTHFSMSLFSYTNITNLFFSQKSIRKYTPKSLGYYKPN